MNFLLPGSNNIRWHFGGNSGDNNSGVDFNVLHEINNGFSYLWLAANSFRYVNFSIIYRTLLHIIVFLLSKDNS